jgi:hypothetical protein
LVNIVWSKKGAANLAEVLKRLHGGEFEWSVFVPNVDGTDGVQLDKTTINRLLHAYCETVPYVGTPLNCYLETGVRLYLDAGDHIETTTGESLSFEETTAWDIAEERRIRTIIETPFRDKDGNEQQLEHFEIHKRVMSEKDADNADNFGTGAHESYTAIREAFATGNGHSLVLSPAKLALLGVHMATRGVFTGAGGLGVSGSYIIAQKAAQANQDYSIGTCREKPVINTRDEPHAEASKWARLHMTLGDANMSPWANKMKWGTTAIVIRLQEHGIDLPELRFADDLARISRRVATDPTASRALRLVEDGGEITALGVQRRLMLAGVALSKEITLPDEELWVLDQWQRACTEMAKNPSLLRDRVEWVLKLEVLQRYADKHGLQWDDERMRRQERRWDLIHPNGSGMMFRESLWNEWMPRESLIVARMTEPPENTRAYLRGRFVRAFSGHAGAVADWAYVGTSEQGGSIRLADPHQFYNPKIEQLLVEQLEKAG